MILDTLDNLEKYISLNPLFAQAIKYIQTTDLANLPVGKIELNSSDLVVNINETTPKTKEEAKLETHNKFIDIQIPLSASETMGYTPGNILPKAEYNSEKDITFFEGLAQDYFTVTPGMFTIFFPQDGHAPGISTTGLKKIIIKVLAY